jgi:hypothetical protein
MRVLTLVINTQAHLRGKMKSKQIYGKQKGSILVFMSESYEGRFRHSNLSIYLEINSLYKSEC